MIREYISERYCRWRDYAVFHATLAGMPDDADDILNEVILNLLEKDQNRIRAMLNRKKDGYRELDFFVLRMIKLNAHSKTSPWYYKIRGLPIDKNIDPWSIEIEDSNQEGPDMVEKRLNLWRKAREVLEVLDVPDINKRIFSWKVFANFSLNSWPGPESYSNVSSKYKNVLLLMSEFKDYSIYDIKVFKFTKTFLSVRPTLKGIA